MSFLIRRYNRNASYKVQTLFQVKYPPAIYEKSHRQNQQQYHHLQHIRKMSSVCMIESPEPIFSLPVERSLNQVPGQGWNVATTVRPSSIPGAGNGRFADIDIPKNTRVLFKPIIPMKDISSILSVPFDAVIVFESDREIENFIQLYESEGYQNRECTIECLAHFIWSLPTLSGATLCFSTWSINHGDPNAGENIHFFEEDGIIIGETVKDVRAGDELLNDYRDFNPLPEFWLSFCEKHGKKDVLTNLQDIIGNEYGRKV